MEESGNLIQSLITTNKTQNGTQSKLKGRSIMKISVNSSSTEKPSLLQLKVQEELAQLKKLKSKTVQRLRN
jgi:hypothetical protein